MENFVFPYEFMKMMKNWWKLKKKTKRGMGEKMRFEKKFKRSKFFVKSRFAENFHLKLQENVITLNSNSKQTAGHINLK